MKREGRNRAVGALVVAGALSALAGSAEEVNRVVLRVNGEIATLYDWVERRQGRIDQISQAEGLPIQERRRLIADAGRAAMKEIFEELLVLSRARQLRIEASPAQIERAAANARQRFGIESEEEFERALAENGMTPAAFRERMARTIVFNQVLDREVQSKVAVSDEEAARYWREHPDEFRVGEQRRVEEVIVLDDSPLDTAAREALARDLAARAATGTLAEAVAAAGAPAGALSGVVELGWVERGALAAELDAAVFALEAPGVGAPVPGRGGLHVVRVVEIRPAAVRPLEEVRERIVARLSGQRFEEETRAFLERQAALAWVVEDLPADAAGYREAPTGTADPLLELMRGAAAGDAAPAVEPSGETPAGSPAPPTPDTAAAPPA
jgi:parvulin-like peptidyl-prolyl isomerase